MRNSQNLLPVLIWLLALMLLPAVGLGQEETPVVKNVEATKEFCGQLVKVIGRYKSSKYIPDASTAGVWIPGKDPIPHITAILVLEDDFEIAIGPPRSKTSLRTPKEAERFENQSVEVTGKLQLDRNGGAKGSVYWIEPKNISLSDDMP